MSRHFLSFALASVIEPIRMPILKDTIMGSQFIKIKIIKI